MMWFNTFFRPEIFNPLMAFWVLPFAIWDLIWKGFALWRAGRNNQPNWFIALLVVNSIGILPIVYLLGFQKKPNNG